MKKYIITMLLLGATFAFSHAQELTDEVELIDCAVITNPLKLGSRDVNTRGEVTVLQIYLSQAGFLDSDPTGYFGTLTRKAVQDFQRAQSLSPVGSVGPATRAKIKSLSCTSTNSSGVDSSTSIKPVAEKEIAYTCPNGKTVYIPNTADKRMYVEKYCGTGSIDKPVACTMEARLCSDGSVMPRDPTNCKWLEYKCPVVKKETTDTNVLKIYVQGSDQAFVTKEGVTKDIALRHCKETIAQYSGRALRCAWAGYDIYTSSGTITSTDTQTMRAYLQGSSQAFLEKHGISKDMAKKYCEEYRMMYAGKAFRCTWGEHEILLVKEIPTIDNTYISEQVECIFSGSANAEQKCYGYAPAASASDYVRYFSCSGYGACVAKDVKGTKGAVVTWNASCGESTRTVIDGTAKRIEFACAR